VNEKRGKSRANQRRERSIQAAFNMKARSFFLNRRAVSLMPDVSFDVGCASDQNGAALA
jgi:hypothetical protein